MQEVGGDHVRDERRVLFLEDNRHDVVANVPLPLELGGKGKASVGDGRRPRSLGDATAAGPGHAGARKLVPLTCCVSPSVKGSLVET